MNTMAREECRREILQRLGNLTPASTRHWGRMSVHQMVCHLIDSFGMMSGERPVSTATGVLQRTVVKWVALYAPVKWPPDIQTRPEIDQMIMGRSPGAFAADMALLASIIETLPTSRPAGNRPKHPIFGRMSYAAWLRWAYLHTDHHLRQFGA
jgi:Protein of unknown function (DUF1569)